MSMKYAFVDEFGAFGFNFNSEGCSTHFIVTAIIVDEENVEIVKQGVRQIRDRFFPNGELKSSSIGRNHRRRVAILNELKRLPFGIFVLVCDKRKIYEQSGLRYKHSFYKFINNIAYQELRTSFSHLVISADEIGDNDFLQSFSRYVRDHEIKIDLFGESLFRFENSQSNLIIQVADIVSGSLAYCYDEHKIMQSDGYNYKSLLDPKLFMIKEFPVTFESFNVQQNDINPSYNAKVAEICYRRATAFIDSHKNSADIDIQKQIAILEYLLFRFMNRSPRRYIPTTELLNQLEFLGFEKMKQQSFRNRIIAKLRDSDVIISSSSSGYKIPSSVEELYDFINHGKTIILPMLSRLKKCQDIIKLGTNGEVDLFERAEYSSLATLIENN
jgi:hypothetical protein